MGKTSCFIKFAVRFLIAGYSLFLSPMLYSQSNAAIDKLVEKYSKEKGLDKNLVKSIILISSGGDANAKSQSGAAGLMQLEQSVVNNLGIKNPFDPEENIRGGCAYLKMLMDQFNDVEKMLAAFNAGPAQVQNYDGVPPIPETQKFVRDVIKTRTSLNELSIESNVYGVWSGIAKYTKYVSSPALPGSIVGQTQPFDIVINPLGANVSLRIANVQLGDPSLYKTVVEKNKLYVEYSGPNPYATPIPNTTAIQNMSYVLDLRFVDGNLLGDFIVKVVTKVHFNIPELNLPDSNAEIDYTMSLNLKKK
ncbi:MAG: hypothetical protein A2499_14850 [Stygiobacter sp. RIFOXYC12_FULL_38_8]|nr:MAG: hypothetical protein A2X62_15480 [Stygiobacter sp. GWC2_38_9]OGU80559.1 MAG: hypothetical protein A2279_03020 [Stygiobacter sp. RIFOXYA12_FULL_38_9]OGV07851.1 MAG: hypothetical protein A2299_06770 [Stygiobacter sp. RIFOXYB2_FULL_37_11]OGV11443.1 MAG: hypothetical protein A2237_00815 [Stygiobacter sp. RIFOXYA2_FULL_38_8]OGV12855.1 MAG: hypothetical protein A2440_16605 [Stygiobacter sp. RIFOXYC2_FULL_38_25]OGV27112.1 MAG: hypothetical protein A2499_14850 [Stygiobacter sp. RIFOXYC12_FULL_